ncbi:hypothetical protein ACFQJD_13545 [Haloplanus sp. GCM10025708]|uniref:hypothetical protein n=1 Tax=Haloferacaceae TaxID=1644056 RepID=UPI00360FE4DC
MNRRWWGYAVFASGVVTGGNALWHVVTYDASHATLHLLANVALGGGSAAAVLYGGYWHATRPLDEGRYPRFAGWVLASVLLFLGLGTVVVYVGSERVRPAELYEALQLSGSVGLAIGLFIGTIEAREITTAEAAARAEAKAEAIEAEKERIERLNDLLRHYVLNGSNVISGYAEELKSSVPPEDEATLDTIADRADTMATLVEHVRTLTAVDQGDFAETDVRLACVLDSVAETRRGSAVTVALPDCGVTVRANELLGEALYLLLGALTTLTEDGGTVTLACSHSPRTATLTVTATPAELPPSVERSLFDPVGSGVSLEFYLAHALLDPYVDVDLVRNADETVRFDLVFDRVGDDTGK